MFSIFVLESEKIHHNSLSNLKEITRQRRGVFLNKLVAKIKYLIVANKSR